MIYGDLRKGQAKNASAKGETHILGLVSLFVVLLCVYGIKEEIVLKNLSSMR